MPRIWTILLLAACVVGPSRSLAKPPGLGHCDPSHIQAEIESTGQVPDLTGCRPEVVRPALSNSDYGLTVDNSVASTKIPEGRIVSQRGPSDSGTVHVDVSTGPPYKPQQPSGGHEGHPQQPSSGQGHHPPNFVDVFSKALEVVSNLPPPNQPQEPPNYAGTPAPPAPEPGPNPFTGVIAPTAPAPQPTPTPPAPPPSVVPVPPAPAAAAPAPAPKPAPQKTQLAQNTEKPPPKAAEQPKASNANVPPPAPKPEPVAVSPPIPPPPPIAIPVPPPTRFSIAADRNVAEGHELEIVIQRENSDGKRHLVRLDYSDPSLLASPPGSFDFGSDLPDRVTLKLRTVASSRTTGDHDLAITLASADGAEVGRPDSVMAVILDQTSWWEKLLERISSLPLWVVALAAVGATAVGAAGAKILMPRASCSIDPAGVDLGPAPLRTSWPALRVDAVVGDASFSIPRPLPIGRPTDAKPKPA